MMYGVISSAFSLLFLTLYSVSAIAQSPETPAFSKREFRVGIGLSEQHPQGRAVQFFAAALKAKTQGKWQLSLFASGKLGNDVTMVGDLQSGKLDFSVPDTSTLSKFERGFSLLNLPYEFDSEVEASRALDGKFGEQLSAALEPHGLIGLGYWENGFRHVTNSRRPLRSAADFKQMKIRVMQNPVFIDAFQSLGATTTPLPFPELFGALKSGGVDAQENPAITILNEKFFDVQKYLTLTRHSYSAWALLISKRVWDQLEEHERALLRNVAIETRDYERTLIRQESKSAIDALKSKGMEVAELPPVELSRVRMLIRERTDKYKAQVDQVWRTRLYMGRLDDILVGLSATSTDATTANSALKKRVNATSKP
jgi:TRAP-type transport system periplasmic protein